MSKIDEYGAVVVPKPPYRFDNVVTYSFYVRGTKTTIENSIAAIVGDAAAPLEFELVTDWVMLSFSEFGKAFCRDKAEDGGYRYREFATWLLFAKPDNGYYTDFVWVCPFIWVDSPGGLFGGHRMNINKQFSKHISLMTDAGNPPFDLNAEVMPRPGKYSLAGDRSVISVQRRGLANGPLQTIPSGDGVRLPEVHRDPLEASLRAHGIFRKSGAFDRFIEAQEAVAAKDDHVEESSPMNFFKRRVDRNTDPDWLPGLTNGSMTIATRLPNAGNGAPSVGKLRFTRVEGTTSEMGLVLGLFDVKIPAFHKLNMVAALGLRDWVGAWFKDGVRPANCPALSPSAGEEASFSALGGTYIKTAYDLEQYP
jgi:hypothetical protein